VSVTWQNLLNVRYLLSTEMLDVPGFRIVHQGRGGVIYENANALPRATILGAYRVTADSAIVDSIFLNAADPRASRGSTTTRSSRSARWTARP